MSGRPLQAVGQPRAGSLLLVEHCHGGLSLVRDYLQNFGYLVQCCCSLAHAASRVEAHRVDLCVVDGEVGDAAVLDACARLYGLCAIVLVAPTDGQELGLAALDAGADDYLTAPFKLRELVARIRAVLRARLQRNRAAAGHIGEALVLLGCGRVVGSDGRSARLTPRQHRLLEILSSRPGEVVARSELLDLMFGADCEAGDRIIDVHVSRLRKRLAKVGAANLVSCYRGVGYRLAAACAE